MKGVVRRRRKHVRKSQGWSRLKRKKKDEAKNEHSHCGRKPFPFPQQIDDDLYETEFEEREGDVVFTKEARRRKGHNLMLDIQNILESVTLRKNYRKKVGPYDFSALVGTTTNTANLKGFEWPHNLSSKDYLGVCLKRIEEKQVPNWLYQIYGLVTKLLELYVPFFILGGSFDFFSLNESYVFYFILSHWYRICCPCFENEQWGTSK